MLPNGTDNNQLNTNNNTPVDADPAAADLNTLDLGTSLPNVGGADPVKTDMSMQVDESGVRTINGPQIDPSLPTPLQSGNMPTATADQVQPQPAPQPVDQPEQPAQPTIQPISQPAEQQVNQPTTVQPVTQPEMQPVSQPVDQPIPQPVVEPANLPAADLPPVDLPASQPVVQPTAEPVQPVIQPMDQIPAVQPAVTASTPATGGLLPAEVTIEDLMALASERKASDIHFAANYPAMLRVDGQLSDVTVPLNSANVEALALSLLNDEQKKIYDEHKEIDLSFTSKNTGVRFRVNLFTDKGNCAGALRLISTKIRTVRELELPNILEEILDEPYGLVLVVGPTGSGKSTTLAAMINQINMTRKEHIVTIEDPIEYVYPVGKSIVNQRELAADTKSWQAALKSALREDPNVVLVGEMRDLDTIESTITIAETGHLTFATLHTNSAAQAIDRIIDVFPEGSKAQIRAQLANVIVAVVSQRLLPAQGGGRRAALEVMLGTVAVRNAIREGKTYQIDNIIQTSGELGMMTLEKSLVEMVKKGYITKEQAFEHSAKPEEIESLLAKT